MRFAVLSDTHYISKNVLYDGGKGSPRCLLRRQINIDAFASLGARTDIDTVLITGDLTDAGDMDSHREFAELLRQLKATGKNVYVLTATHDFHFSRAYVSVYEQPLRFRARPWEKPWCDMEHTDFQSLVTDEFSGLSAEECVPLVRPVATPDDLWEIYREFGRDQAFSTCESAYSYAVKLDDKTWCLMLNNNFRDYDANYDASPSYSPACYKWIQGIMEQAKKEGAFVFACTHHPLVPPVPAYKLGGTPRNMRNPTVCHYLADLGLTLVFSGHTHFANIVFGSSDRGNVLCNVTTPSLSFLPPAWRIAELDGAQKRLRLTTVDVEKTPEMGVTEPTLRQHFISEFISDQRRSMERLPHGLGKVVLGLELRHLYPLCRGKAGLTDAEYQTVRHRKFFDLVMDLTVNMQAGDGRYTPDTPEYKFLCGLCAVLDSIVRAQPFYPLEKKLQGYTLWEIVRPMLFQNGVPDNDADFVFDRLPEQRFDVTPPASYAGDVLMLLVSAVAALLSPAAPAAAALAVPALTLLKRKKLKEKPYRPERY